MCLIFFNVCIVIIFGKSRKGLKPLSGNFFALLYVPHTVLFYRGFSSLSDQETQSEISSTLGEFPFYTGGTGTFVPIE